MSDNTNWDSEGITELSQTFSSLEESVYNNLPEELKALVDLYFKLKDDTSDPIGVKRAALIILIFEIIKNSGVNLDTKLTNLLSTVEELTRRDTLLATVKSSFEARGRRPQVHISDDILYPRMRVKLDDLSRGLSIFKTDGTEMLVEIFRENPWVSLLGDNLKAIYEHPKFQPLLTKELRLDDRIFQLRQINESLLSISVSYVQLKMNELVSLLNKKDE